MYISKLALINNRLIGNKQHVSLVVFLCERCALEI